ncbi:MAG: hypothetical protein COB38_10870 [Gammaproteobacteria bacterium]|nr:MAG: hypothetical protein COB38_10870 [Gammaproteobacteria bacterium]
MEDKKQSVDSKKHIFDNPKNVKRLLYFLYTSCAVLLIFDFVIHRHVMHSWENLWGFYPLYGFVGCVVLVIVATWMRTFLMRAEDYYDSEGQDLGNINNKNEKSEQGEKQSGDDHVDD